MGKRGLMIVAACAVALVLALVFLVSEARDGGDDAKAAADKATKRSSTSTGTAKREPSKKSSGADVLRDRERRRPNPEPGTREPGQTIKTTADGRQYVESIQSDGRRVRDFRKTAVRDLGRKKRLTGPRLLEAKNATSLKSVTRPKVWSCVRAQWKILSAMEGIGKLPTVVVYVQTSLAEGEIVIKGAEVELEANEQDSTLARCIEGALEGLKAPVTPGVEQKPYEDFEVGLRFRVPPPKPGPSSP